MHAPYKIALKYLHFYLTASNGKGHGTHSPFVFEFITKVLNDRTFYPAYDEIEKMRGQLMKNNTVVDIDDFGAGSAVSRNKHRTVGSITKTAVKSKKFGQLLYRLVKFYQPAIMLELGTSVGITTSYIAKGNPKGRVFTMEGAGGVLAVAKENFRDLQNINPITGNFDHTLPLLLHELSSVDFAFIDGNHRLEPTVRYFEAILAKTNNFSFIVVDDINWSEEMWNAWKYCKEHPAVTLSIDLFFIGILVFRKEIREKQHFKIRF